jgi:predicted Zn-dependent peptidase
MAVEHLADMFQNSVLREDDFVAEKRVILEEINVHEDTPDDLIHDLFTETLWPDHPLGRPILGTKRSIKAATRDQVRRFYRRHYVPGNLVVVAAGNLQHDQLVELLSASMETGPVRAEGPAAWNVRKAGTVPAASGRSLVKRRDTEQAHMCVGTTGLSRTDPDRFAFGVVNTAIGGGMSSRLFQEIREKRGLAYSVYSYHSMYAEAGLFAAYAGTTPGRAKEVLSILRAQLENVAREGLAADEFERAKGHMKGSLVLSLEDPGGRMSRLGKSEISHGETLTVNQLLSRITAVTPDDARRAAERVLSQPMTTTVLGPFNKGALG